MNDAPRDNLDIADVASTEEKIIQEDEAWDVLGWDMMTIMALGPDGDAAGYTKVILGRDRPEASWQGDTGIVPAFRRRGIGRWIKAEMWKWLQEDRPEISRLRTGNAATNDSMLAINVAMGFRPVHHYGAWQIDVDTCRAALAS